ncbi:MAG: hypothetical protein UV79_C0004G0003 [candidate division TM6 bacterium GW2011_GWF2_43_17]|nr:MAG: hypothetical protein UV79_C0004G0003 [candidate division TM6 bacterium GW2011_GWF2_43_17]
MRVLVKLVVLVPLLLFGSFVGAQINKIECALELRQALEGLDLDQDVLFVFDIDETILVANNPKARSAWFGAMLAEQMKAAVTFVDAINETRRLYRIAQEQTTLEAVDPELIQFINDLHQEGVRLIGLTSRSRELCDITPQQLAEVGLVGFGDATVRYELQLHPHEFPLIFENGVFFTSGAHKGLCLGRLLRELNWQPKTIIFIDDSYHHVEAVEAYASMVGIPAYTFHFTGYQKTMAAIEDRLLRR